jgi:hypothetical protein
VRAATYKSVEALRRRHVPDPARDLIDDLRAGLDAADTDGERAALVSAALDAVRVIAPGDVDAEALESQIRVLEDPPVDNGLWDEAHLNPDGSRGAFVDAEMLAGTNPILGKVLAAVKGAGSSGEADEIIAAAIGSDVEWSDGEVMALAQLADNLDDDGTILGQAERDERDAAALFAQAVKDREAAELAEQAPTLLADAMAEAQAQEEVTA